MPVAELPIAELISKGVELMFLGMGTVFVFLAVLVFVVGKMSVVVKNIEKRYPPPAPKAKKRSPAPAASAGADHIAAISAAVHRYRTQRS